jgi:hypothetical protein
MLMPWKPIPAVEFNRGNRCRSLIETAEIDLRGLIATVESKLGKRLSRISRLIVKAINGPF